MFCILIWSGTHRGHCLRSHIFYICFLFCFYFVNIFFCFAFHLKTYYRVFLFLNFFLHVLPLSRMCKQIIRYFWGGILFYLITITNSTTNNMISIRKQNTTNKLQMKSHLDWKNLKQVVLRENLQRWNSSYWKRNVIKTIAKSVQCHFLTVNNFHQWYDLIFSFFENC